MAWNWQQPDWPNFSWDKALLEKAEQHFLMGSGVFAGTVKHLATTEQEQLTIEAISSEALTTSEIEGEVLDRASLQSSIRRQLGLATDNRKVAPAERGISEMMVNLYRSFAEPLSDEMLFEWHQMLFGERGGMKEIGCYRSGKEPMEVISGAIYSPKIHFEAPPSSKIRKEMRRFVDWFNNTTPTNQEALPALTRAGVAHLYFESLHPFEDGNGRIGRAIAEKALAQGSGQPTLTALAATILTRRKAYYDALEAANKHNEITGWLSWFAGIVIEAQKRTAANVEFLIDKTKLLDRMRDQLNARQEKALLRMLREGPEGFKGGLSAGNYVAITGTSAATATRDLADLVAKGALLRMGELRHTRYELAIPKRPLTPVVLDKQGNVS
jgi:Fic family protein